VPAAGGVIDSRQDPCCVTFSLWKAMTWLRLRTSAWQVSSMPHYAACLFDEALSRSLETNQYYHLFHDALRRLETPVRYPWKRVYIFRPPVYCFSILGWSCYSASPKSNSKPAEQDLTLLKSTTFSYRFQFAKHDYGNNPHILLLYSCESRCNRTFYLQIMLSC
jgi:hypothetical protein